MKASLALVFVLVLILGITIPSGVIAEATPDLKAVIESAIDKFLKGIAEKVETLKSLL